MSKIVVLDYENDHDYSLIGFHTPLQDYRLAFFLNHYLNIQLKRSTEDLDFTASSAHFSLYNYDCKKTFTSWSLIANKYSYVSNNVSSNPLFKEQHETSVLIYEMKQIDYFLKIEGDMNAQKLNSIITKINNIKNIVTSYSVNPKTLKSKDFLIF